MTETNNGILYGDQNFVIPSHMNCGKFITDKFLKCSRKIALIDGVTGESITFGGLVERITNTTVALTRLGVQHDDVVAVCSENRTEFFITIIAIWCSGAIATVLNPSYSKNEMVHILNIAKPIYVFFSPDAYKNFYETIASTKIVDKFFIFEDTVNDSELINFNEFTRARVEEKGFEPPLNTNGLLQPALILYSSGTTGLPKGARITHLNVITFGSQLDNLGKDVKCLSITPWCNTVGIVSTLIQLQLQRTVIFLPRFREEQYLQCIETYKAGLLIVVPPILVTFSKSSIIQNYDTSSIEFIYCGGATIDLSLIAEVKRRFLNLAHFLQGYGMTETTGVVAHETVTEYKEGSIGKIVLGAIAKVADINTGKTLGPLQKGELRIKGPLLFGGYINKHVNDDLDENGFFKSGDICYYDEEGYIFFVERIKELIKYKAGQVSPSELEAILLQHPAVKDVGVTGKPDNLAGELPTAFVVKKPGARITSKELVDYVASKVSSWKQLRGGVHFIEEIPKLASGKILRRTLREMITKSVSKL